MNLLPFLDFAILQFMVELVNQEGQVKIMHGIKVSNFTKFSRFLLIVIILFSNHWDFSDKRDVHIYYRIQLEAKSEYVTLHEKEQ